VHHNIAVASVYDYHFDVYLALVWTLERVIKGHGSVQVYAATPFAFGFQNISNELGLYRGAIKDPNDLLNDIRRNTAIDMVIFGTCESECVYSYMGYIIF
jgi:hypothetical protein